MCATTYRLQIDETYRLNGEWRNEDFLAEDLAVAAYNAQRRGFASIVVKVEGVSSLLTDSTGRKYIKGSPFYEFPHVPHISILDGREIETT